MNLFKLFNLIIRACNVANFFFHPISLNKFNQNTNSTFYLFAERSCVNQPQNKQHR